MPPVVDETRQPNSMQPVQEEELNRMLQAVKAIDSTVVSLMVIRKTGTAALVNTQEALASPAVWPRGGRW